MPRRSFEQFGQFYPRESIILPPDISQAVEELNDIELQTLSVFPTEALNHHPMGWMNGLTQALNDFPSLLANVSVRTIDFVESFKDQIAAGELITRFGTPESLLAVPVFAQLMSREVQSKLDTSLVANNLYERATDIREWLVNFILLLQLQLANLELEISAHQQAVIELNQVDTVGQQVNTVKTKYGKDLNQKIDSSIHQQKLINWAITGLLRILRSIEKITKPIAKISHQFPSPSLTV